MRPQFYSAALESVLLDDNPRSAFMSLTRLFLGTSDAERSLIRENWNFGRTWDCPVIRWIDDHNYAFGPVEGVDQDGNTPEALLEAILVAMILRGPGADMRDDIAHLAFVHHIALEADIDPEALFARVAAVAGEPIDAFLTNFERREPEDKSLWAMGFRKQRVGREIVFEWIGLDRNYRDVRPKSLDQWGREK